jgi:competence protein ComEC
MAGFALLLVAVAWGLQRADARTLLALPAPAWVIAALGAWALLGRRPALLVLVAGWTLCRAGALVADRLPEALAGADVLVQGAICDFPRRDADAVRFVLELEHAGGPPRLPARLHLGWYDDPPALAPGQRWQLLVRLKPPRGTVNPGAFDFEGWLYGRGIGATGYVRASVLDAPLRAGRLACPVGGPRGALARRIEAALAGHPAAGYVLGLTVGATHLLGEDDWALMRATGTTHLLAISGLNIAMVVAPILLAGPWVARLAPGTAGRPQLAAGVALAAAAAYSALSGFAVSTVRALVMLALATLLVLLRRPVDGRDVIALAAVVVTVADPPALVSASFWLSFLGVAWLVFATLPPAPRQPAHQAPSRAAAARSAAARAAAGLARAQAVLSIGLAPLTVVWFPQLSLVSPLANLVAIPVFSLLAMPAALAGAALVMVAPDAAGVLLRFAADVLGALFGALGRLAAAGLGAWPAPWPGATGLALGTGAALLACWWRPVPARAAAAALLLPVLGGAAAGREPLRLTVLDVGQGLAALVETPRHALLYDAGPAFRNRDAGESVVLPVLRRTGVRRLDALVVSHDDSDHAGGVVSVLEAHPRVLVLAPVPPRGATGRFEPCVAGRAWRWDGVRFEVLSPPATGAWSSDNDGSCVLRVTTAGASLLLTGDIEARREADLARRGLPGRVDLVVAPHHGSRSSSSAALVAATRPRWVVVSAGWRNRWGFPAPEVVRRWTEAGACVLGTAAGGALAFTVGADGALRPARAERRDGAAVWTTPDAAAGRCESVAAVR